MQNTFCVAVLDFSKCGSEIIWSNSSACVRGWQRTTSHVLVLMLLYICNWLHTLVLLRSGAFISGFWNGLCQMRAFYVVYFGVHCIYVVYHYNTEVYELQRCEDWEWVVTKLSSCAVLNKGVHEKLYKYKGLKLILSILQWNLQFSLLFEALLALPLWKRTSIGVSIRISVGCFDILGEMLGMIEKFIMERCMLGLCVLDRGGTLSRLHLQIICKIYISSLATLNKSDQKKFGLVPGWKK